MTELWNIGFAYQDQIYGVYTLVLYINKRVDLNEILNEGEQWDLTTEETFYNCTKDLSTSEIIDFIEANTNFMIMWENSNDYDDQHFEIYEFIETKFLEFLRDNYADVIDKDKLKLKMLAHKV